jgi:hypothetical protein
LGITLAGTIVRRMNIYSIETNSEGGYEVRVAESARQKGYIAASFATWRQAQEWIDTQMRIALSNANASDVA